MQNDSAALPILSPRAQTLALVPQQSFPEYSQWVINKRDEFTHLAPQYELQCLVATLGRINKLRRRVAELAVSHVDGPALELCCGTGGVTAELAQHFDHVIGVDLTPDMLLRAQARIIDQGLLNVELREADVSTLRFADHTFSSIVISLGLHELPVEIRESVLRQGVRWLKPGGRLVFCDYRKPKNRLAATLFRWIGKLVIERSIFSEYLEYPLHRRLESFGYQSVEKQNMFWSCFEVCAYTTPMSNPT